MHISSSLHIAPCPLQCVSASVAGRERGPTISWAVGLVELRPGEDLWIDSEDMESCFNLFRMPKAWRGMFAFSKKVPRSVVGDPPGESMYVAIQTMPMGWVGAVDVMQEMARHLVYGTCGAPIGTKVHKIARYPTDPNTP